MIWSLVMGLGLEQYVGTGAKLGMREEREVRSEALVGAFVDYGLSENGFASFSFDYGRRERALGAAAKYAFPLVAGFMRPYAGLGGAYHFGRGTRPDTMLGLVLPLFVGGNAVIEARWRKESADLTLGYMSPL